MSELSTNLATAIAAGTTATTTPANAPAATTTPQKEGFKEAITGKKETKVAEKAPEAATPKEKKIWKLKADGEEFEFDASDEERVKQEISKARGANKRFEEAAAVRKQAEQALAMLKDPVQLRKLLENPNIGVDLRKFAEDYLWEHIQEDALTPEQKKAKQLERELDKYREAEKTAKTDAESKETEALQNQYFAEYEKNIMSALEIGGIPKTKGTVRRMAQHLQVAVANGIDVTPQELVARVRQELIEEHKSMYASGDANSLLSILGDDLAKKIREADLKRLKSTQPEAQRRPPSTAKPKRNPNAPRQKVSQEAFAAMLSEKLKR